MFVIPSDIGHTTIELLLFHLRMAISVQREDKTTNQMEDIRFAAIKRYIDSDNHDHDDHIFNIVIFEKREDAAKWLLSKFEFYESHAGWDDSMETGEKFEPEAKQWKAMYDFLMESENDEGLFHWTWKRRSCNRSYRIVKFSGELKFNNSLRTTFKLKDGKVVQRSEK